MYGEWKQRYVGEHVTGGRLSINVCKVELTDCYRDKIMIHEYKK